MSKKKTALETVKVVVAFGKTPLTLRQQCGLAVQRLMEEKDIPFTKMAKLAKMPADKFYWYLIGDRRASPEKDMDLLEKIGKFFGGWSAPAFVDANIAKKAQAKAEKSKKK